MIRIVLVVLSLFSPFFFPWPLTLLITLAAAFFVPCIALVVGVLIDVLYFVPGSALAPVASLLGLLGFVFMFFVHRFWKTRIIGAW